MTSTLPQPVPHNLRELMISFIQSAPEEQLPELNKRLLIAERDRLWSEVQAQAQADADAGKYENVPEMVREYRARNKAS